MERREFLGVAGAIAAGSVVPRSPFRVPPSQGPTLGPEAFARRLERLQAELKTQKLDLLVLEPGTNFQYFAGYNPGRSERLILLMVPAVGTPALVCPSFEVERIKRNSVIGDVRGWEEQENPWRKVGAAGAQFKPPRHAGVAAVEPETRYHVFLNLEDRLGGWKFVNGASVTERLRIIKSPEEIALIRRAIDATEASIAATFAQLAVGMTERDVAQLLSREMASRGSPGGGLVQFGPSSALPHGGPSAGKLARETVVLIDAGSRIEGYTSDITRTIWFGDAPPDEFKKVYNLVHDAQTAAMQAGRPLVTQCQELDRLARKVITDGGYGQFFTHRLGHGMGMDGHEAPYLVEGNETRLEPGMVFTIEPGIYQLNKWGVRIEDDCTMTENGIEVMSHRPAKL
ncbi:MAG TPA: Xaa-Pro peptidase family protein [Gemmatimonadales bacterium]|jgi:Xaa-Pro dipeptidase|nr:Xaa-Pro peptidase family protein [Gemmatimonadales bacterium]